MTLQATIEEKKGQEGDVLASFTPSRASQHQVSVTFKGKHLQGSPFSLEVADRPLYRRDYNQVGDQPVCQFGSKGANNGQFNGPYSVACNFREKLLSPIEKTIAFRCLIEMGTSCLSLGHREMETASFMVLVVSLSTKGIIKL